MVSCGTKQQQQQQQQQRRQRKNGVGRQRCATFPRVGPALVRVGVALLSLSLSLSLSLLCLIPSGVEGTLYLPQYNRSYVSLPGLFGKPLHENDPPVSAYLTTIPNQPYMCPDELKNIRPKPPQQFLNNHKHHNNGNNNNNNNKSSNIMDNSSSNSNSNNVFHNNNGTDATTTTIPAPDLELDLDANANVDVDYDFDFDADVRDWIEPLPAPEDGLPIALLVERGLCTFWEKAEMASRYGSAVRYVVIFDDIVSPDLVPMSSEYSTDMTLLFVSALSGHELRDYLTGGGDRDSNGDGESENGDDDNNNEDNNENDDEEHDLDISGGTIGENSNGSGMNKYNGNDNGNGNDNHDDAPGLLVWIDGERPTISQEPFPSLQAAAYFLAAMSGFLAFLIFFGCLLICAQCGCITAAPDEHGRIVLFAGGPGIRHTEGLARMIRVHKLTREQVETLEEEEFTTAAAEATRAEEGTADGGANASGNLTGDTNEGDSSCCCCICLDEFEDREMVKVLPCGHKFHGDCLVPWLTERDASCPLCKMDVLKHVLEAEKKSKAKADRNKKRDGQGGDGDIEADKDGETSRGDESETGDSANDNDQQQQQQQQNVAASSTSRGTSPVRSVWYRLRGWSLIANDAAPSDHRREEASFGRRAAATSATTSRSSLEAPVVVSEIEMEHRRSATSGLRIAENAI